MKKRIIPLLLFLLIVVSGCQKKSPHHPTTAGHGVEINGSLKLHKDEYLIQHNIAANGVFLGDSVVDCDFNMVASFPGCYIDNMDTTSNFNNLVCKKSDVLFIKGFQNVEDKVQTYYRIYSLEKNEFIFDEYFSYILKFDSGLYLCSGMEFEQNQTVSIINSHGQLIKQYTPIEGVNGLKILNDRVVYLNRSVLTYYDSDGNELFQKQLPKGWKVNFVSAYHPRKLNEPYIGIEINGYQRMVIDQNGNQFTLESLLKKYVPKEEITNYYMEDAIVGIDEHLYVYFTTRDGFSIIVNEKGDLIFEDDQPGHCILNPALFEYQVNEKSRIFSYDGTEYKSEWKEPYTNDFGYYIFPKKDGVTMISNKEKKSFTIDDPELLQEDVHSISNIEAAQYSVRNSDGTIGERYTYKGLRFFDEYSSFEQIGDYVFRGFISDGKRQILIMDLEGHDIYRTKPEEKLTGIIPGKELYFYVFNGNYEGIIDTDGNYLYRRYTYGLEE